MTQSLRDKGTHIDWGANDETSLNNSTVQNDANAIDRLTGNSNRDWLIQSAGDLLDAIIGEVITAI